MYYICIDFDGTIVEHKYPYIGQPVPGAIEWIKKFEEIRNISLILYTMRGNQFAGNYLDEAYSYLNCFGIYNIELNNNPSQQSWTSSPKIYGNIYIDDAAIGTPLIKPKGFSSYVVNWSKIGPMVMDKLKRDII